MSDLCEKCLELKQTIYLDKCRYKEIVLRLNKIIEKQEEELEILRTILKKMQYFHDTSYPSFFKQSNNCM